jgi:hypothetical protein
MEASGDDAERVPRASDAAGLLEVTRGIWDFAPRWVDLSCGHDEIVNYTSAPHLPRALGDTWFCFKCNANVMVFGIAFTETEAPAFDILRAMINAVNGADDE